MLITMVVTGRPARIASFTNSVDLLAVSSSVMAEKWVKSKRILIRRVERTGLMHMVAQHLLQRCLEQVGRGMGSHDGYRRRSLIHGTDNGILNGQGTAAVIIAVVEDTCRPCPSGHPVTVKTSVAAG